MTVYIVNTPNEVVTLLNDIENQPTKPPSLYLDIEGVSLSRHGSISIIQLYNVPQNHVFLIDVFVLRQAAFDTPSWSGITLRSILESERIPKVFFDVRNDSDALYAHFNILLQGCHDVQLLHAATQPWARRLAGLRQCIEHDAQLSVDVLKNWQTVKVEGRKLFSAKDGGSYEIFNVRPLLQDIITYCAQDVVHLPILWSTYSDRLSKSWLKRVEAETAKRVMLSQAGSYDSFGDHKVWSPWAKNVKDKHLKGSSKGGVRQNEGDGLPAIEYQGPKERMRVAELVNMKLAHRQAEKVPSVHSSFPASVGNTEQQASKQITNNMAAQVNKGVPKVKYEPTLTHTDLPTRSKGKAKAKPVEDVHNKIRTPGTSIMWTCTACSREMLESQKEAHLAGKAHVARVKQVPSAASNGLSLPGTGEIDVSQTAKTSITKKRRGKAKVKAESLSEQAKFGGTGSKGTQRRARAAVTTTYPTYESCGDADWGFIGFDQGFSLGGPEQDDYWLGGPEQYNYWLGGGDNYGLCDKDCGWCGHCMDNVDI